MQLSLIIVKILELNKYTDVKDIKTLSKENDVKIIIFYLKWRSENI